MEQPLTVLPPLSPHPHTHTVIWLHGRGDTAAASADALFRTRGSGSGSGSSNRSRLVRASSTSLKDVFPSVRWVFPSSGHRPCEGAPGEEISQWFDIWNVLDLADREELQLPGLCESVESVRQLVRREAARVGGLDRVVLAGISQGAATAVHTLFNLLVPDEVSEASDDDDDYDDDATLGGDRPGGARLAGFMAISAFLPLPGGTLEELREVLGLDGTPSDSVVQNTPTLVSHCADDPLVFVEYGRQLVYHLREFGVASLAYKEYKDGGHWINSPRGVDDIIKFLMAQGVPAARGALDDDDDDLDHRSISPD
ncbi:alpha/beta-hydrolase [Xylariomycetidae sp. FL2044]|nr:alpha/beta-hydrolase [Xylariomycetidae sp. FL2044]